MNDSDLLEQTDGLEIAVVGMACRVPGARNVDEFWENLRAGVEAVTFFTDEELQAAGVDPAMLNNPSYVKAGAVLEDIELFDAAFFGINPREAETIDPQQRIFLECAWEALESAGYNPESYQGRIGLYAGVGMNFYLHNLYASREVREAGAGFQIILGNDKDFLTTRVSYKLDLRGPSITVQSACSTSLVAVCLASESLLSHQCSMALAGGVSIILPQKAGYFYQAGGIASPDGHCRAFDAEAQGAVGGSGVGVLLLKRLSDALSDGDSIHAVIKGTAVNNDGAVRVGYTAPSVEGQAQVIKEALDAAGVEAQTITYVETHGAGTPLGDTIEIAALKKVFEASTGRKNFCAIGSVKTNVGHLDTAAGVAGLIKTVLALKHGLLPPSLNFERPNPQIDFASSPFYVNTKLTDWKMDSARRRAGVSSFGIGGTNAHVILEEAPAREEAAASRPYHLLLLSARSSDALDRATERLAGYLRHHPELNPADVAYTMQVGRKHFNYRRMLVCRSVDDAYVPLEKKEPKRVLSGVVESTARQVAFMFTGLGDHYAQMGRGLYESEPVFRQAVDDCAQLLAPWMGLDIRKELYPEESATGSRDEEQRSRRAGEGAGIDLRRMLGRSGPEAETRWLNQTRMAQPVVFVVQYALARLLSEWGIKPRAMIGYSLGEYTAACLAGVFSLPDALRLVAQRAQLIQALPSGGMLAVALSEKEVAGLLNEGLSIAANNGLNMTVVAGSVEELAGFEKRLSVKGVTCRNLQTSHAFHSHMMRPALDEFTSLLKSIELKAPAIPFISNVTGKWITADEATDPQYWAQHMCRTVKFAEGILELGRDDGDDVWLEVGPGRSLTSMALQLQEGAQRGERIALPTIKHVYEQQADEMLLMSTLGKLWLAGVEIDWRAFSARERRRRLSLPTYPFERERFWVEPQKPEAGKGAAKLGKTSDLEGWFYIPSWKRSTPLTGDECDWPATENSLWALFVDEHELGEAIALRLEREGHKIIRVRVGSCFERVEDGHYCINPELPDDYHALTKAWRESGQWPRHILYLWNVSYHSSNATPEERLRKAQRLAFNGPMFLAQAIGSSSQNLNLLIITNNMQEVTGGELSEPEKALVIGPCRVIGQEYPNINCRSVDIDLTAGASTDEQLCQQLIREALSESGETLTAYRGSYRWIEAYESLRLSDETATRCERAVLRVSGVYLITGGLGGVGLELGKYLAKQLEAKLILVGRTGLPAREQWQHWLDTHPEEDSTSRRIKLVKEMENDGAEVLVIKADVTNAEQMRTAVEEGRRRFGQINGVIHAAGVAGAGIIQLKTTAMAESVMQPKVMGLLVLDQLFKGEQLDFIVTCSSLASILGGFGQVDYTAANAFLDAYARSHRQSQAEMTAINWDAWQGVGMAATTAVPEEMKEWVAQSLKAGLLPTEGVEVFRRALGSGWSRVVVSTQDFDAVLERNKAMSAANALRLLEKARLTRPTHQRPQLRVEYVAPTNETERRIADIWQDLLGIEQVGIHDNFLELGGHSLLAIQITSRLRHDFEVELSLPMLFQSPTVAELALVIEDSITSEVAGLAEDEVLRLT